jgi:energy-coupling factor transporter ATP-binding protein EcfA2
MTDWERVPPHYRQKEVQAVLSAAAAGECVLILGLSGAGKSNLMSFLAQHGNDPQTAGHYVDKVHFTLIDCNRLREPSSEAFFRSASASLGKPAGDLPGYDALEMAAASLLQRNDRKLSLLIDRFEVLSASPDLASILSNLRALRDAHKYRLSYVISSRRPIDTQSELAELFYANTIWLGPLEEADARWNIQRFAHRKGLQWSSSEEQLLQNVSGCYPSFIKAACEALAGGAEATYSGIVAHPAVQKRLEEFALSRPSSEEMKMSGLLDLPILKTLQQVISIEISEQITRLTAKEHRLLEFLKSREGKICEKDDLVRAVWLEDQVFSDGIRDDSLAQLVRRLREKVELDPSNPRRIVTVPGRGYIYRERTP